MFPTKRSLEFKVFTRHLDQLLAFEIFEDDGRLGVARKKRKRFRRRPLAAPAKCFAQAVSGPGVMASAPQIRMCRGAAQRS